jgi:predicted RNA binding protein YcfA (HicA-like mRNA interferase family)
MPKLPRVSGAKAVRAPGRLGFANARQSGSQVVMRRGAKGVVPLHVALQVGTLAGVLRRADMSIDDFVAHL